jgi:hypothetical protein
MANELIQIGRIKLKSMSSIFRKLKISGKSAKLSGLGIIVSPEEDCAKGFERLIVTSPLNKKVHICRLAPGYRKKDAPKGKPARQGPLRRRKEFGPGIEHQDILPKREHKVRKAERKLTS